MRAWVYLDRDGAREQAERLTAELKARAEPRAAARHPGRHQGHHRRVRHADRLRVEAVGEQLRPPGRDRACERLRQAGAVILGKTVTTAFASFDPPVTRNPWNLDRTPGGS